MLRKDPHVEHVTGWRSTTGMDATSEGGKGVMSAPSGTPTAAAAVGRPSTCASVRGTMDLSDERSGMQPSADILLQNLRDLAVS